MSQAIDQQEIEQIVKQNVGDLVSSGGSPSAQKAPGGIAGVFINDQGFRLGRVAGR